MSPSKKQKTMVIKVRRHPLINMEQLQDRSNLENRVRKCRVNLERLNYRPSINSNKPKRCIVRIARLPNMDRSEISATPVSSIACSDFDNSEDEAAE